MPRRRKRDAETSLSTSAANAVDGDDSNLWLNDVMVGRRVVEDTRHNYTLSFHFLSEHARTNIPNSCDSEGMLKLPMENSVWVTLLSDMAKPIDSVGRVRAFGTIQTYISAIKFFYQERGIDIPRILNQNLSKWMDGYKRKIADLKSKGIMKNKEGKLPLSYLQYERLSELALFAADTRAVSSSFTHLFMILCWNLFARSCSVSDLHYHHLSWDNDALIIDMSKHKADQSGERITPKHIYANPFQPAICPILALALHIFGNAFRADGEDKDKVFLSRCSYDNFCKWFAIALKTMSNLGFQPEDFGTHSFRKGISSFVAGFIGGPGIITIFLRAGWSVGPVQDRYLTYADGGDQLCGRIACGLNFNKGSRFAVLPPTFANPFTILTEEEWSYILPGYLSYPSSFRGCLPFLLSSIAFHWPWITCRSEDNDNYKNISKKHPIFRSRLFMASKNGVPLLDYLRQNVLPLNTEGACDITNMKATGIPPHIDQSREIEKLRAENEQLRALLIKNHSEIMEDLPKRVTDTFRETITAPGLQQMSAPELRLLLKELIAEQRAASAQIQSQQSHTPTEQDANFRLEDGYGLWCWRGRFRKIPPNYSFPGGSVKEVCDLFFFGVPAEHIRPFRMISCSDFVKADEQKVSKARAVYDHICSIALENSLVSSRDALHALEYREWDRVFKAAFQMVSERAQATKKRRLARAEEKSYSTVFDWTRKTVSIE
jgi:hypothetical protein